MVTELIMPMKYFRMTIIPIEFDEDEDEYVKDLFYVDYCNCCDDLDLMDSKEVPCHHPWYCWHDGGEVQEVEFHLASLHETERMMGYLTASEREELYFWKQKKFELVKERLRKFRKGELNGF